MIPTLSNVAYGTDADETLDVFNPNGPALPVPILVEIHGGGWEHGTKDEFNLYVWNAQQIGMIEKCFADGVMIVSINYPLCADSTLPNWSPKNPFPIACHSVQKAMKFIRQNAAAWGGDPNRVYAIGGSAGGHLALWAAYDEDVDARPDGVIGCFTPTAVTKQLMFALPARPALWNLFGCSNSTCFNSIPDATTQAASPYWKLQNGDVDAKLAVPFLGVYNGDPTKQKASDFTWPTDDPHGSEWGVLLKSVAGILGKSFADFALSITPNSFVGVENQISDLVRDWLHTRAWTAQIAFGAPAGVIPDATKFHGKWIIDLGPTPAPDYVAALNAGTAGYRFELGVWRDKDPKATTPDMDLNWATLNSLAALGYFKITVNSNTIKIETADLDISNFIQTSISLGLLIAIPRTHQAIEYVTYTLS